MKNLANLFTDKHNYFLESIDYKAGDVIEENIELQLVCTDKIEANYNSKGIRLVMEREISFNPEKLFRLKVRMGVFLEYNEDEIKDVDLASINWAEEFLKQGEFVTGDILSRISLLAAQITGIANSTPLILPPQIIRQEK